MEGFLIILALALGIYFVCKVDQDRDSQQKANRFFMEEEEEKQRREEIIRSGIAYNAWNHMRNHDGNPYNDSVGSAFTPGTDAWKANRRF
ncbi:hypothetical protein [Anaerolinea thermophila]|uniref:Uncharacterized protein n=1 Tax=Anaerolinea thermophila (strain DSM 14523 / JCM 11388 / NBRC 100420 / UNI-1) TaxID=926569 RepID=E8MZ89_ANATU|nr:hypothetical protein [Anaerolinea thermophila]BAJ62232.1 hypothetical protein ANT_01980 [Anaerolinea thermophila UNI-1]